MTIAARLNQVRSRIERAAERAGRDPNSIRLVAVSKFHPTSAIREARDAGQTLFGENYVQELVQKAAELPEVEFRFIGHLQKNKAKDVVRAARCIETVDSLALAEALSRRAERSVEILIQVNVAGETQKSGCAPAELVELHRACCSLPNLRVTGLMTIPPQSEDPESARTHFRALRILGGELGTGELSMGMSADLEVAIEEGATIVRVGTAIFGPRPPVRND